MRCSKLTKISSAFFVATILVLGMQEISAQSQPSPSPAPGPSPLDVTDKERITALESVVTNLSTQVLDLSNSTKLRFSFNPPVGSIMAFAGPLNQIPENWRLCNGDTVAQSTYSSLWQAIGTTWGGSGATAFKLPDLRGVFLRGVDSGVGRDPDKDRRLGSIQPDAFKTHDHPATSTSNSSVSPNPHTHGYLVPGSAGSSEAPGRQGLEGRETSGTSLSVTTSTSTSVGERGGPETRPINVAVYWIIKVKDTPEGNSGSVSKPAESPDNSATLPTPNVTRPRSSPSPSVPQNR
jgi:microcystin-dependent protein